MRSKLLASLVALIGISAVVAPPLAACGDKFLALGRYVSLYQGYASLYPGGIALYSRDPKGAAVKNADLKKFLTRAGHSVTFVGGDLGALVKASGVDVVLALTTDADAVRALIGTAQLQPTVLYVAPKDKRPVAPRVTPALKHDDKPEKFIQVVEDAMKARTKAGVKVKP